MPSAWQETAKRRGDRLKREFSPARGGHHSSRSPKDPANPPPKPGQLPARRRGSGPRNSPRQQPSFDRATVGTTFAGSTSVNLSSQGGSFILVSNAGSRGEQFTPNMSVELKLPTDIKVLKKVTLPTSLAGDLLLRCHKFGVSAASVFPGYDGVAKAVLELALIPLPCRLSRCF